MASLTLWCILGVQAGVRRVAGTESQLVAVKEAASSSGARVEARPFGARPSAPRLRRRSLEKSLIGHALLLYFLSVAVFAVLLNEVQGGGRIDTLLRTPQALLMGGWSLIFLLAVVVAVIRRVVRPVAALDLALEHAAGSMLDSAPGSVSDAPSVLPLPLPLPPRHAEDDIGRLTSAVNVLIAKLGELGRKERQHVRAGVQMDLLIDSVFENASEGVVHFAQGGKILRANPPACIFLLGDADAPLVGTVFNRFLSPADQARLRTLETPPLRGETSRTADGLSTKRVLRAGTGGDASHRLSISCVGLGEKASFLAFIHPGRKGLVGPEEEDTVERHEARLQLALRAVRCGIWEQDLQAGTFWWSAGFLSMIGYEPESLPAAMEMKYSFIHPEDVELVKASAERYLKRESADFSLEYRIKHRDGSWVWVEDCGTAEWDGEGRPLRFSGTMMDCTARKRFETQLMHMATHDSLTQLPNRTLLQDRLDHALAGRARSGLMVAALLIDIDRFQLINDSLGHEIGDQLLREVAKRLQQSIRPTDTLSHLAADEFVVVCEDLPTSQEGARIAKRLISALRHPFLVDGNQLNISVSIGIGVSEGEKDGAGTPVRYTAQDLLRQADIAMHSAKASGGGGYRFFVPEMNKAAVQRLSTERHLVEALEHQQFRLHYQPKVDIETGKVVSAEALIRWSHRLRGNVPPDQFIPIAEETGLILGIGEWVLREALSQICAWRDRGYTPVPVAVNLSAKQLMGGGIDEMILRLLREYDVPPHLLEVEITESSVMSRVDRVLGPLGRLRDAGVGIALDDFGTGYSSLAWLRQLPITSLKIDRSFVRDTPHKQEANAIAAIILEIGRQLGLTVVAEGIETAEQHAFLREHRCHVGQGWLFYKAMPATAMEKLLPGPS